MTDELKEKLKAQHGDIYSVSAPSGEMVVVRMPDRALWKRFRSHMADERRRIDALENLVRGCVVHPDAPTFDAMLEKKPGLAETFGAAVVDLAGMAQDSEKKAL